jgi:hypothetical protein
MLESLDIFIKMESGTYLWKGTAETFELAKTKVKQLATTAPGEYLIFSQRTQEKTVVPLDATERKPHEILINLSGLLT